jgi:hypothetical protein
MTRGRAPRAVRRPCRSTAWIGTRRTRFAFGMGAFCRAKRSGSTWRRGERSAARVPVGVDGSGDGEPVRDLRRLLHGQSDRYRAGGDGDARSGLLGPAGYGGGGLGVEPGLVWPVRRSMRKLCLSRDSFQPGDPGRQLQQQRGELACSEPQQRQPDGPQQQHRLSLRQDRGSSCPSGRSGSRCFHGQRERSDPQSTPLVRGIAGTT